MRNKVKHNAGNAGNAGNKQIEISVKKWLRQDLESNHGPPACRADILTTTPLWLFEEVVSTFARQAGGL